MFCQFAYVVHEKLQFQENHYKHSFVVDVLRTQVLRTPLLTYFGSRFILDCITHNFLHYFLYATIF